MARGANRVALISRCRESLRDAMSVLSGPTRGAERRGLSSPVPLRSETQAATSLRGSAGMARQACGDCTRMLILRAHRAAGAAKHPASSYALVPGKIRKPQTLSVGSATGQVPVRNPKAWVNTVFTTSSCVLTAFSASKWWLPGHACCLFATLGEHLAFAPVRSCSRRFLATPLYERFLGRKSGLRKRQSGKQSRDGRQDEHQEQAS